MAQTLKVCEASMSANKELVITIAGEDMNNYIATGFYIELPDDFSASGIEAQKTDNVQSDHVIKVGQVADNKIRVAAYSLSNSSFNISKTGGSTSPLTFCVVKMIASNTSGSFKGKLSGIEFATSSHGLVTADPSPFDMAIRVLGDADGDGTVDVNDVTTTINYILKKPYTNFIMEAADVDGDKTIDVNDVQGIIDIALGKAKAAARKMEEE